MKRLLFPRPATTEERAAMRADMAERRRALKRSQSASREARQLLVQARAVLAAIQRRHPGAFESGR